MFDQKHWFTHLRAPPSGGFTAAVLCLPPAARPTAMFNLTNTKNIIISSFETEAIHGALRWRSVPALSRGFWGQVKILH